MLRPNEVKDHAPDRQRLRLRLQTFGKTRTAQDLAPFRCRLCARRRLKIPPSEERMRSRDACIKRSDRARGVRGRTEEEAYARGIGHCVQTAGITPWPCTAWEGGQVSARAADAEYRHEHTYNGHGGYRPIDHSRGRPPKTTPNGN
jgi:hypothetical protein